MPALLRTELRGEQDVVLTRQRARQIAELIGFDVLDQTRIATAVSEIARNAFRYAGGGRVEFSLEDGALGVQVRDQGPGIPHLEAVLEGRYQSETGMGIGIAGARRLMDHFEIRSEPRGTEVRMRKALPASAGISAELVRRVGGALAQLPAQDPLSEVEVQNRELLKALSEMRRALQENERLSEELSETNRGVMALLAEIDEKNRDLQRASELKSRFLSHMSHEFRTPLNSILSLSGFLLDRLDGDLTAEQEKQVGLIRSSAQGLFELVNDLLDLAKIEAGKIPLRPAEFTLPELFGTLRGMFRPLLQPGGPALVFEDPDGHLPPLFTDEGRVSQILRNFVSNALKFTEHGEVRVWAEPVGDSVRLSVRDTGIGIAAADQGQIFEEFTQVENPLQRRVRGTGLGLPLSRKLAELLGGSIELVSAPGEGSTFTLSIPVHLPGTVPPRSSAPGLPPAQPEPEVRRERTALLIDDDEAARYVLRQAINRLGAHCREAEDGEAGLEAAHREHPDVIFLDLMMPGISGFEVLAQLKEDPLLQRVPVVVVTSLSLNEADRRKLQGAAAILSKNIASREAAVAAIGQALVRAGLSSWLEGRGAANA